MSVDDSNISLGCQLCTEGVQIALLEHPSHFSLHINHNSAALFSGIVQRWDNVQQQASARHQQSHQLRLLHVTARQLLVRLETLQQHYADCTAAQEDAAGTGVPHLEPADDKHEPDVHSLQQLQDRLAIAQVSSFTSRVLFVNTTVYPKCFYFSNECVDCLAVLKI